MGFVYGERPRARCTESHVVSGALALPTACACHIQYTYECALSSHKSECLSVLWQRCASHTLSSFVPGRISRVVDLPVSKEDGLSPHLCRPCMRKFQTAETLRSMAKSSYEKQGYNKVASPLCSVVVHGSRKRMKDTSGFEASPHTAQARPQAKRCTLSVGGRRLAFPSRENSKIQI